MLRPRLSGSAAALFLTHAFMSSAMAAVALAVISSTASLAAAKDLTLLNASYDPTRELYHEFNDVFAKHWKQTTGETVTIRQSNGGSGAQARAVIDGLEADVVTLGLAYDIDVIADKAKLLPENWQSRLPNNSTPYTSTIVFVVRKGNPKGIHDWPDVVKPGVSVVTPNPKTSGGARWNFLAAWSYALKQPGGNEAKAEEFVTALYKNVPVLDTGARGSTITFSQRQVGDVLLAWKDEALMLTSDPNSKHQYEVIYPSSSIQAEPPVAVVDKIAEKHATTKVAQAYLEYLYTDEGQEIIAKHHYRPRAEKVAAKYASAFPKLTLYTVDDLFGGWRKTQPTFFSDGGVFDQIYVKK
jgi:sulfate/thiosulfate transport system substrate-binding protein